MFSICQIIAGLFFAKAYYSYTDTLPKKISQRLEQWSASNPSEKVFLHTDKSTYLAGETIWYKAYLTLDARPTALSRIVYIDVVDETGKVVDKQMRPVTNGTAFGDISLSKELPTGNYSINAYSLWMLNYQPFIFKKNIMIYNYDAKPSGKEVEATNFMVNFFPEGGELVEGLKSNVAIYATDNQGLPIDIKGTIIDKSNRTVASISTARAGYGKFEITPSLNEIYSANINVNGVEKKFTLPVPKKEGIVLKVNNANPNMTFVKVDRNVANTANLNKVLVVAQVHGKLAFVGLVNFEENATGMGISKKNLQPGIMHITAFDSIGNPLAERLAFINNYEGANINLAVDSLSLQKRGKNKFKIDLSTFSTPSVSVAVTDGDLPGTTGTENSIVSSLFLTSDLKGYIHEPGYYFQNKNAATTEHLDLLMLTHGWRRFKWEQIINNKEQPLTYPVESGITVSGKVTVPGSSKNVTAGFVDIITKGEDSTTILSKASVNDKGQFIINDLNFRQKATVYLQGTKSSSQNANVDIIINPGYIDTLKRSVYKSSMEMDVYKTLQNDNQLFSVLTEEATKNKVYKLADVKVTSRKMSRLDSLNANYAGGLFLAGQSLEITSSHYLSIWQFLREQVSGLAVEGDMVNPNVHFTRLAGLQAPVTAAPDEGVNDVGGIETNGITYYLNEINVSKDVISTLYPGDIALIKVFKGPEGAVLGVSEGGIAIYTKKGTPNNTRPSEKGFFTEKKIGYSISREFFNPNYSVVSDISSTKDNRTTLFWNGNVKVDKSGIATFRFFNNDITKKYRVVIQGIDQKGSLIYKEQIFK